MAQMIYFLKRKKQSNVGMLERVTNIFSLYCHVFENALTYGHYEQDCLLKG